MGRLVVVGCGTVVPEGDHGGSCHYLETGPVRALLDCGPGAVQGLARHGLPWAELTDLLVTHFHADHVGALPGLLFSLRHAPRPPRRLPLRVHGPAGTRTFFARLAAAFGPFVLDPGFPVEVGEVEPGGTFGLEGGVAVGAAPTPHTEESLAYRIETPEGTVGYTGDTGPGSELGERLEGCRLLLAECSLSDDEGAPNHLTPSSVAALARRARPDLLVLTHVYPHLRRSRDVAALVAAAGWDGEVRVAHDGGTYRLP